MYGNIPFTGNQSLNHPPVYPDLFVATLPGKVVEDRVTGEIKKSKIKI